MIQQNKILVSFGPRKLFIVWIEKRKNIKCYCLGVCFVVMFHFSCPPQLRICLQFLCVFSQAYFACMRFNAPRRNLSVCHNQLWLLQLCSPCGIRKIRPTSTTHAVNFRSAYCRPCRSASVLLYEAQPGNSPGLSQTDTHSS